MDAQPVRIGILPRGPYHTVPNLSVELVAPTPERLVDELTGGALSLAASARLDILSSAAEWHCSLVSRLVDPLRDHLVLDLLGHGQEGLGWGRVGEG